MIDLDRNPQWAGTKRVLLRGGDVYSPADPFATAILLDGPEVAWIGSDGASLAVADGVDVVVDLQGALVTPAFVDGHVHSTATGLLDSGLDLRSVRSAAELLGVVTQRCAALAPDELVLGHGWEENHWTDPRLPSSAELEAAAGGRPVFLSRIDVHSSLVSPALIAGSALAREQGDQPQAPAVLRGDAHFAAREIVLATLSADQRRTAHDATRRRAATLGIALLTEMSGPRIGTESDFEALLGRATEEPGPLLAGYWGELGAAGKSRQLGALGAAGDLFIDGALGSRTAALRSPYADVEHLGSAFLDAQEIAEHVMDCTEEEVQGGFHAIGDQALDLALEGFRRAAHKLGVEPIRALRHRLEHVEVVHPEHIEGLVEFGITASVQPGFDAAWGGPTGMYAQRLGDRWASLNPLASLAAAGVPLVFGSDCPVTPLGPWSAVRAAVNHHVPEQRISARAAFAAHTRGGWRAAGSQQPGALLPGAPAHLAVWEAQELVVQAPDDRIEAWSTDPRSGTPGLPDMSPDTPDPQCLATVVAGRLVYDDTSLDRDGDWQ